MTKILKTIIAFLLIIIVFLLWTGLDTTEYEDENIVTVEYECDRLADYEKVPTVVIKECLNRSKK